MEILRLILLHNNKQDVLKASFFENFHELLILQGKTVCLFSLQNRQPGELFFQDMTLQKSKISDRAEIL